MSIQRALIEMNVFLIMLAFLLVLGFLIAVWYRKRNGVYWYKLMPSG